MRQPRPLHDCPAQVGVSPWKHLRADVPDWWEKAIERCHSASDPRDSIAVSACSRTGHIGVSSLASDVLRKKDLPRHTREQPQQSLRDLLKRCISQFLRTALRAEWNGRLTAVLQGGEYSFLACPSSHRERESQRALVECSCCCLVVGGLLAAGDNNLFYQMLLVIQRPGDSLHGQIRKSMKHFRYSPSIQKEAKASPCQRSLA